MIGKEGGEKVPVSKSEYWRRIGKKLGQKIADELFLSFQISSTVPSCSVLPLVRSNCSAVIRMCENILFSLILFHLQCEKGDDGISWYCCLKDSFKVKVSVCWSNCWMFECTRSASAADDTSRQICNRKCFETHSSTVHILPVFTTFWNLYLLACLLKMKNGFLLPVEFGRAGGGNYCKCCWYTHTLSRHCCQTDTELDERQLIFFVTKNCCVFCRHFQCMIILDIVQK